MVEFISSLPVKLMERELDRKDLKVFHEVTDQCSVQLIAETTRFLKRTSLTAATDTKRTA